MNTETGMDQFNLLEEKVDNLITLIKTLKVEKQVLADQVQVQEEKLGDLNRQIDELKGARDKAKQRITSLLEKIENMEI